MNKKSQKLDKRLARIVSYITFDGHLDKNLKGLYFSSNNKKELENIRKDINKKFRISLSKTEKGNGYGKNILKY